MATVGAYGGARNCLVLKFPPKIHTYRSAHLNNSLRLTGPPAVQPQLRHQSLQPVGAGDTATATRGRRLFHSCMT